MSKYKVPYFQVPNAVFDGRWGLTIHEIAVYIYLCRCSNQGSDAYPSLLTIAEKTGMGRSKASETVKNLERKKLITIEKRFGRSNIYQVYHQLEPVHDMDGSSPRDGRVPIHAMDSKKNSLNNNSLKESSDFHTLGLSKKGKSIDELLKLYYNLFRSCTGKDPTINAMSHRKKLENLINQHSIETIKARLNDWFNNADRYTTDRNYPLPLFVEQFDSVGVKDCKYNGPSNYYKPLNRETITNNSILV